MIRGGCIVRDSDDVVPRPRRSDETDDRARIEEAIAEAKRRGVNVYLPAGDYVIG
jgi:polygalacturonase